MARVLICGGYGTFGLRAAERLGRDPTLEISIAGRRLASAERAVAELQPRVKAKLTALALDATAPDARVLRQLAPDVIYNASGPFQAQDYTLARAAIASGAHYVDLADGTAFVANIGTLDAAAKAAGVLVVSGASTVPGLSSAVVDRFQGEFKTLEAITYGIVPANGFEPGLATTESILSYVGRPFATLRDGRTVRQYGWQGLWTHRFPDLGVRRFAACDIPDLVLFPARYPSLRTLRFGAGLEVPVMHYGLWGLSWLVRLKIMPAPERLARTLLRLKTVFKAFGTDAGGMFMVLEGRDHSNQAKRIVWHVVARKNQGPYIPQVAATLITRKLLAGTLQQRGAMACLGMMTLAEFTTETADLAITTDVV
jgi:Saccharopine dehydrogenase NADP binding domain